MDALRADYAAIAAETGARRVVANLPYNIATPLIVGWLSAEHWPPWFDKLVVMVQREVADRFVANPAPPTMAASRSLLSIAPAPACFLPCPRRF